MFLCWISALFQAEAFTVRLAFTAFLLVVAAVVFLTIYLGVGDRWFRGEAGGILVLQPDGLLELRQRDRDPVPGKIGTHSWVGRWFCVFVFRERGGRRSRRLIAWRADQEREHYRRLRCWLLHRFAGQGDAESVRAERRLVDFTRRIARVRRS